MWRAQLRLEISFIVLMMVILSERTVEIYWGGVEMFGGRLADKYKKINKKLLINRKTQMILNISCLVSKQPNIKKVGDYFSGARD